MSTQNIKTASDEELLEHCRAGETRCLEELFERYQDRLKRMVRLRLDPRVKSRVDASDVLQEAYIEIYQKLEEHLCNPKLPFYLWLRLLTGQKLALAHRRHLGAQVRDAGREVSLFHGGLPEVSSAELAAQLMGNFTSPSQAAVKTELKMRLQEALNSMEDLDREVLTLRHFEQLSNSETATVLGISESAACNRYVRALKRLKAILEMMPQEGTSW